MLRRTTPASRSIPWLLLPILAAVAAWQLQQRFVPEHGHEEEGEEWKRVGAEQVVGGGSGWVTRRYQTKGGYWCLDTTFSDGHVSGGCFDLGQKKLQWGRARYGTTYIISGWAPPGCPQILLDQIIHSPDNSGWFIKQVEGPVNTIQCK